MDESFAFKSQGYPSLIFTKVSDDRRSMWAAIMEKAWVKVRGNYINANGGFVENGIHMLLGVPVFAYRTQYIANTADAEVAYQRILAADA